MNILRPYIKLLFLLLFFSACENKQNDAEIIILCTNDVHGSLDNFPKLGAYYKKMKQKNPNTFLFSNGDMFSGNPLVDQHPDKGSPMIDIMNKVGYCISSLGNHEFDYGQEILEQRIKQAEFPFICANIEYSKDAALKPVEPYKIFDVNGVSMAVLSLVEVGSGKIPSTHPDRVKGLSFEYPINTVGKYAQLLRKNDIFILLAHIGVDRDVNIAEKYPEVDLILGGHSHTKIDTGMVKNGVLITQASSNLRYVGETRIIFKDGKIVSKTNKLVDINKLKDEDAEIKELLNAYKEKDPGKKVIGQLTSAISGKQKIGAMMTDAITEIFNLDIAIQNSGGIRLDKIPAGDLTINTIHSLDPFGNEVVKVNMTYNEIEELLKLQFGRFSLPDLIVSGISYTINLDKDKKPVSLDIFDKNGKSLDKSKKYSVGMNSYIYSKYKFSHKDEGESLNITSAGTLINFIEKKKVLDYNIPDRIKIK